jgi:benzoyl-CoA reductase/2-hydroxyglutaryl-CoA dehydratase subunit BcrC/BadD/HgdB
MIDELKSLKEGEYVDESLVKIVWSGVRGVDFSVYNALDVIGGYVAEWNLPTSVDVRYDLDRDPLEAMVDYDLADGSASEVEVICQKDIHLVEKSGSKGIVLYTTLGCGFLSVAQEVKRRYLSEKDIPVLILTGTSQIGEATGQVKTRLKAFLEMIA